MDQDFTRTINDQLRQLLEAQDADDVIRILAYDHNPFSALPDASDAFFTGQEDEDVTGTVWDALRKAEWRTAWSGGENHYVMRAPDGSTITYDNGRVYRGDRRPQVEGT